MTPDLILYLRSLGWLILPLALAEGFFIRKRTEKQIAFGRAALACLLVQGFSYFVLMIMLPEAISRAGWRLIPDFYIDHFTYFTFALLALSLVKYLTVRLLCFRTDIRKGQYRRLFLLYFACFNLLPLVIAGVTGLKTKWNWSYDVALTFPHGVQYYTRTQAGQLQHITQRNFLGAKYDKTKFPFEEQADTLLYRHGTEEVRIPMDYLPKQLSDGREVRSNPGGGLILPDGTILNYQTLLHRWEPAVFAVLPGTDCILFQTGERDFLYDIKRKNLYDLAFGRGKILFFQAEQGKKSAEKPKKS